MPALSGLNVVYADGRLIVLNKPEGLLSVPGLGPANQDCLSRRAAEVFPGARIVHRLDQHTSGLIVMALDADAHRDLSRQFEQRRTGKRYIAVVAGRLEHDEGEIDLPLRKDMDADGPRHIVDHEQGKPALTRYRVLDRGDDRSRLALRPHTGRSHQLRVHLKELGHPILGDVFYAPPAVIAMATRLLLHAQELTFAHPDTGERVTFEAACPF